VYNIARFLIYTTFLIQVMQVMQYSIMAAAVHEDAASFFTKKKNHFKVEN
jgi:hypothetical protein